MTLQSRDMTSYGTKYLRAYNPKADNVNTILVYSVSDLVGEKLYDGCSIVCAVPYMILSPHQILHHQTEEYEETQQVCPDVYSLVVKLEDAL